MGWIVAIIVGGIAGWLASMVMARDASMGIFWNIIVGIIGAILGNAVIAPLIGVGGSIQTFNLGGFIIAIMGCYNGFFSKGGAQGVGAATTNAVVASSILILAADFALTAILFHT